MAEEKRFGGANGGGPAHEFGEILGPPVTTRGRLWHYLQTGEGHGL